MAQTSPQSAGVPAPVLAARRRAEMLVSSEAVAAALDRLSIRLALRLAHRNPMVLAVMHGALPLAGALLPRFDFPLQVGYLHVGRYGDATRGGALEWHAEPGYTVSDRTVLLLDDVLDRGATLAALVDWARAAGAREVVTAVLVDKAVAAPRPVQADYAALICPDRYLFGCGMDYQGYWRNLPAIYALPDDLADGP
ncbi:MAG: hypoxanthine-guanine phosphoribosyltransferase [Gammaproteobacteria bacterium]|nr:hypoxanthine-guanine phosphoribosyltransferase [Gammaproteobacteria bacterium]